MKVGISHSRWLAPLLVAGTLLLALAPQSAAAHGGYDHDGGLISQPAGARTAVDLGPGIIYPATHGWSASCPGGSGGTCCCSKLTACAGSGKNPVSHAGGWVVPLQPFARVVAPAPAGASPPSLLPPSLVLPRAPPFFS